MKSLFTVVVLATLFGSVSRAAETTAKNTDAEYLLYTDSDRLLIFKIHILVDGKSHRTVWKEQLDKYFKDLDSNNDGALTGREIDAIPSQSELMRAQLASSQSTRLSTGTRNLADSNPRDGKVTPKELREYLNRVGVNPFSVVVSQGNQPRVRVYPSMSSQGNSAGKRLFERLDTNNDGKLSLAELKAAEKSLRKSDLDDDGTISSAELQTVNNPYVLLGGRMGTPQRSSGTFLSLSAETSSSQMVRQLLNKYDKTEGSGRSPDGKLSAAELRLDTKTFSRFDADGDGKLDFTELQQFLRRPPAAVEMTIRLGKRSSGKPLVELTRVDPSLKSRVKKVTDQLANLKLQDSQIDIGADSNGRGWVMSDASYDRQFEAADADNNGYLTREEGRRYALFSRSFELMDADKDGKLFKKEFQAYMRRQSSLAGSRTLLNVSEQGRDLFQILDLNRDQRLSKSELEAAAGRIAAWDTDGDRQIAKAEIPRQYRLSMSRGRPGRMVSFVAVAPGINGRRVPTPGAGVGPKWFVRMDRNQDGEVARREFLGPLSLFKQLDSDGNGRLNLSEAEAAESKRTKKPGQLKKEPSNNSRSRK